MAQNSPMDIDPHVGLYRPSPDSPSSFGEKLSDIEQSSPTPHEESGEERGWKEDLCHAISGNNWSDVKTILDQNPNALTVGISFYGRTALHVAAQLGHVTILEELLKLLTPESLLNGDSCGDTALSLASWSIGITQVAKCLVNKNRDIVGIPNKDDDLPVAVAFRNGYPEMGRYLYFVTPLECLTGCRGSWLLVVCFHAQNFDINIPSTTAINHVCVDFQQENRSQGDETKLTEPGHGLLLRLITFNTNFVGVKKIQELKLQHAHADDLLRLVCKNARKAYQKGVIDEALCLAAKEGNVEFVFQVSKVIPEIFLSATIHSCFHEALVYRHARVFNLLHGLRFKQSMVAFESDDGNLVTLMHKAAIKAPDHVLNRIYAPTLQMQRELQWFKEVESLTPPMFRGIRNKDGMTAEESFRESHTKLMKQGEKWIKDTASSCSLVGTLIVTIMFAVAFTVPGGNNQNLGYPLFIKQPFFKVFIFSTILSLLSSSTSVLMFLAILTSQYSEEKFLKSLPTKLILGLSFLFISILSMIIAFLSTIRLMVSHTKYSWGLLPIIILASIPVFLFVLSQFPLLLHTYVSTYGNIFDRKVKPWP